MSCCFPGPRPKQCISCEVDRGGDCESNVSGCAKADGLNDVHKHVVVRSFPDWSCSVLSTSHNGMVNLCWPWGYAYFYAYKLFNNQEGQPISGMCQSTDSLVTDLYTLSHFCFKQLF